jgi:hypothetical protein
MADVFMHALWIGLALGAASASRSGSVMDSDGEPVARAQVWLTVPGVNEAAPEVFGHGETDAGGRFTIALPREGETPRAQRLVTYAPGKQITVVPVAEGSDDDREPGPARTLITIW